MKHFLLRSFQGTKLVLWSIVFGILMGALFPSDVHPHFYEGFRFLSKAFLSLIKGLILPLIFTSLVHGIAQAGDIKLVGRLGVKALLWFEIVTTFALFLGLFLGNILLPGQGLPIDLQARTEVKASQSQSVTEMALHLFPSNLAKHAVEGDLLPIVVFSVLFGLSLTKLGKKGEPLLHFFDTFSQTMFVYTGYVMRLTPLGVFGAMAASMSHMASGQEIDGIFLSGSHAIFYLIAKYIKLIASLYLGLFLLIVLVFIPVLLFLKLPVRDFLKAIKDPVTTAFATASSESALPSLLKNLKQFGLSDKVVNFVVPAGYSFNLDGSTLYLVLASLSISQASKVHLSLTQQLLMVFSFVLTSKGVAGVPRATLVIIAATCGSFGLPGEAGVAMLLAVDELMDMGRSATNVFGNAIAAVVVSKWEERQNLKRPSTEAKSDQSEAV